MRGVCRQAGIFATVQQGRSVAEGAELSGDGRNQLENRRLHVHGALNLECRVASHRHLISTTLTILVNIARHAPPAWTFRIGIAWTINGHAVWKNFVRCH